jgi:hypothetical protein
MSRTGFAPRLLSVSFVRVLNLYPRAFAHRPCTIAVRANQKCNGVTAICSNWASDLDNARQLASASATRRLGTTRASLARRGESGLGIRSCDVRAA